MESVMRENGCPFCERPMNPSHGAINGTVGMGKPKGPLFQKLTTAYKQIVEIQNVGDLDDRDRLRVGRVSDELVDAILYLEVSP